MLKNGGGKRREINIGRLFCSILTFQHWEMRVLGILLWRYVLLQGFEGVECSAYFYTLWLFVVLCGGAFTESYQHGFAQGVRELSHVYYYTKRPAGIADVLTLALNPNLQGSGQQTQVEA